VRASIRARKALRSSSFAGKTAPAQRPSERRRSRLRL
jgi:hypothetical protein